RRNRYFILKWDFSIVNAQGDAEEIKQNLHQYLNSCAKDFISDYRELLSNGSIEVEQGNAVVSFLSILRAVRRTGHPLYLLIDEYDNFANEVMMSRQHGARDRYEALLYGEGALKSLFKAVKAAADMGLERVFITGVSPVAMSDVSSAYNVSENISGQPEFSDLCGFREAEVAAVTAQVVEA
ncbi:MAG: AAA family ATPase, partial [Gammaproteobacteria bacterium]|nr:AAA family ATPase [Gammaproteobacteria bacterium]